MGQRKDFASITPEQGIIAWQNICAAELGRRLVLEDVVLFLSSRGNSVRQIAEQLGESASKVHRIIKAGGVASLSNTDTWTGPALKVVDEAWQHVGGRPYSAPWRTEAE